MEPGTPLVTDLPTCYCVMGPYKDQTTHDFFFLSLSCRSAEELSSLWIITLSISSGT